MGKKKTPVDAAVEETAKQETAEKAAEKLQTVEGIKEVNDGMENPSPELKITVNKEKAMLNGLTVAQIYAEIAKNILAVVEKKLKNKYGLKCEINFWIEYV